MTDVPSAPHTAENRGPTTRLLKASLRFLLKVVFPLAIILAGVGFYRHQMNTRPQAERRRPERQARLVTVETVHRQDHRAIINAMGTVRPATEIALTPEITGRVVYKNPHVIPGGLVKEGQVLYRIDSRDYEKIVRQRQSEVSRAELELKLEQGNQAVALQEYELLGEEIRPEDRELVLREPQLQNARDALTAAQAALARAKLDVERCTIAAPFNAVITAKHADIGARVPAGSPLATLTGTDVYWVEVSVPAGQLQWIPFPEHDATGGAAVRIFNPSAWGAERSRQGRVLRLMGQLEEVGRMAQLLAAVPDPLGLKTDDPLEPLLIGSYVRVEIAGHTVPDVVVLPRAYLRDGGYVWVMNDADTLEIRRVEIVFRGQEAVYVRGGLADDDRVVSTDLSAAVDGMPLRLEEFEYRTEEPQR